MSELNKKYKLQIEVLTPLHVGAGSEKDWVQGCDFVVDNNHVKVLNLRKVSQYVNNTDLTNALLKKDDQELKAKLANNLDKCVEKEFDVNFFGSNEIKTFIKNGLTQNPIVPGSSIKGALRSIVLDYLMTDIQKTNSLCYKNLDEKEIFGKANDGDEFFRFIKISDAEFSETILANTKIFNLRSKSEGGWKHGINNTTNKFNSAGFNTFYEVIAQNNKSTLSLSIANVAFENFNFKALYDNQITKINGDKKLDDVTKKKQVELINNMVNSLNSKSLIINSELNNFFKIINLHTKEYLEKEKAFFEKYSTNKTELIVESINSLLGQIPQNGEYCILKMSAGSGFHSITGDWQFDDFKIDRLYSEYNDRKTGEIKQKSRGNVNVNGRFEESAKSRKIAIYKDKLYLMGFVKLTVMDEKMLAAIEKEKEEQRQIEFDKLQKQQQEQRLLDQQKAEIEAKKTQYNYLISEAQSLFNNNDYTTAQSKIAEAEALKLENNSHLELKKEIDEAYEYQRKQDAFEDKKLQMEEQRKAEIQEKLKGGLSSYLDEKNLKNEYKVKDFKMLKAKIEKFLKDSKQVKIPENQFEALDITINRVCEDISQREQIVRQNFEKNKICEEISNWSSTDFAKTVFDNLNSKQGNDTK